MGANYSGFFHRIHLFIPPPPAISSMGQKQVVKMLMQIVRINSTKHQKRSSEIFQTTFFSSKSHQSNCATDTGKPRIAASMVLAVFCCWRNAAILVGVSFGVGNATVVGLTG